MSKALASAPFISLLRGSVQKLFVKPEQGLFFLVLLLLLQLLLYLAVAVAVAVVVVDGCCLSISSNSSYLAMSCNHCCFCDD